MFVADVNMSDVVSYLRRFRASIAAATAEGPETEAAPILRRLDAFLTSHLGR